MTNNSTSGCWSTESSNNERLIKISAIFVTFVFAVFWNTFVIVLVAAKRVTTKNMNILIANMTTADLIFITIWAGGKLVELLSGSTSWTMEGIPGSIVCKIVSFLLNMTPLVSLITLLMISYERYRAVTSMQYRVPITRLGMTLLIVLAWGIPTLLNSHLLVIFDTYQNTNNEVHCDYSLSEGLVMHLAVVHHLIYLMVVMVIFILSMVTIRSIRHLRHSETSTHLPIAQQRSRLRLLKSVIQMVLTSLLICFICWSPLYVFRFVIFAYYLQNKQHTQFCILGDSNINLLLEYLSALNSAISPLICFIFLKDFRSTLKRIVCCGGKHKAAMSNTETQQSENRQTCNTLL